MSLDGSDFSICFNNTLFTLNQAGPLRYYQTWTTRILFTCALSSRLREYFGLLKMPILSFPVSLGPALRSR